MIFRAWESRIPKSKLDLGKPSEVSSDFLSATRVYSWAQYELNIIESHSLPSFSPKPIIVSWLEKSNYFRGLFAAHF